MQLSKLEKRDMFEEKVKGYITSRRCTQAAIARELGYSPDTVNKWVRGVNQMPLREIHSFCELLNLDESDRNELFDLAGYDYLLLSGAKDSKANTSSLSQPQEQAIGHGVADAFHTNIPFAPEVFIGRESDVARLRKRMKSKEGNVSTQTIVRGWPGVGKTAFITSLANAPEVQAEFPDGILWAVVGMNPNPIEQLGIWERTLGFHSGTVFTNLEAAISRLRDLLRNRRVLLIIDDVWDSKDAVPLLVSGGNCFTLITTRFQTVASELATVPDEVYWLDLLALDKSVELFTMLAPRFSESWPVETEQWLSDIERLPLAIHVGARLLEYNLRTMGVDYARKLMQEIQLLRAQAPKDRYDPEMGVIPTVEVILQQSTNYLDEKTREKFAYLGVFAPKPATFDLGTMEAVWLVEDARSTASILIGFGLLEPTEEGGRFRMHALLVMHAVSIIETSSASNQEEEQ